jgi:hypothetical protein
MSITDTINTLIKAYPKNNLVNHVTITFVIPILYLKQNKDMDYRSRQITFEYDYTKKEPVDNIISDLQSHGKIIGYNFLEKEHLDLIKHNIKFLIENEKDGIYVTINLNLKKKNNEFDLLIVKGKLKKPKFTVTTFRANSNSSSPGGASPKKKTPHRLRGQTNSYGTEIRGKTRTVQPRRVSSKKSPLASSYSIKEKKSPKGKSKPKSTYL